MLRIVSSKSSSLRRFPPQLQQRRPVASYIFKTLRLVRYTPYVLGLGAAGSLTYVNYRLNEAKGKVEGWYTWATGQAGDVYKEAEKLWSGIDWKSASSNQQQQLPQNNLPRTPPPLSKTPPPPSSEEQEEEEEVVKEPIDGGGGKSQFLQLTKRLIEIRQMLKSVDGNDALRLPSIVVIGSQSSGKSSVLESIVGHQFLPKGDNMVTRRPIELTLIHTPESNEEYGEFPQLGLGKLTDFRTIQRTLADLNKAVSDEECIAATPIELRICSPNVPDLTLVDLPGYIQVSSKKQPPALKQKIVALVDQYIQEPNIILAVCAADVDLANSEALQACRRADPIGSRTIGVITKMDLVQPERGIALLENHDYPLLLGYIGVVCKKLMTGAAGKTVALRREEKDFFERNYIFSRPDLQVGVTTLRRKLTEVLEEYMSRNLSSIYEAVQADLEETRYQYKVQFNDRRISPEAYVTDALDTIKEGFKQLTKQLQKPQVRAEIRTLLEQRALDICAQLYWSDQRIQELVHADPSEDYWQQKLGAGTAALTKSGVGRGSTQLIVDLLKANVEQITMLGAFKHHLATRANILGFSEQIFKQKFAITVNQVENTIKPYKYEVEATEQEWKMGVKRAIELLETELKMCDTAQGDIRKQLGQRKLSKAIRYLVEKDIKDDNAEEEEGPGMNASIINKAKEALKLKQRAQVLRHRLAALKSRQCRQFDSKAQCPEAFFSVVIEKLAYTASMFVQVELLNEFFYQFPRELDNLLYYGVSREEMMKFAQENPDVAKQLALLERRTKLEQVLEKLSFLMRGRIKGTAE